MDVKTMIVAMVPYSAQEAVKVIVEKAVKEEMARCADIADAYSVRALRLGANEASAAAASIHKEILS